MSLNVRRALANGMSFTNIYIFLEMFESPQGLRKHAVTRQYTSWRNWNRDAQRNKRAKAVAAKTQAAAASATSVCTTAFIDRHIVHLLLGDFFLTYLISVIVDRTRYSYGINRRYHAGNGYCMFSCSLSPIQPLR